MSKKNSNKGRPSDRLKLEGDWEDRAADLLKAGPMPKTKVAKKRAKRRTK
jgi:hypothetical protein